MRKSIQIGTYRIAKGNPPFVIAEAGVNHQGKFRVAQKLIDAAAATGADAVKFQTFKAEEVVTSRGRMARYQEKNLNERESQQHMLKKLELPEAWYPKLISRAKQKGILFLSTPHGGFSSVDLLQKFRIPAFKFGSGDITNLPLLSYAARLRKPMLISAGMSTLREIKEAIRAIKAAGNKKIIVFQCTTSYPAPLSESNLRVLKEIERLGVLPAFSDHTQGNTAALISVALGAVAVEKHLTLNSKLAGPDQKASMEPKAFKEFVATLKSVPRILGVSTKRVTPSERSHRELIRKSIVAGRDIKKGERLSARNLAIKRPGRGLPPKRWKGVLGKRARMDIPKDAYILGDSYR